MYFSILQKTTTGLGRPASTQAIDVVAAASSTLGRHGTPYGPLMCRSRATHNDGA